MRRRGPKNEPTDSYFYLSRQLANCMMRSDTLNWHDYGCYTEMTAPYSNVNSTDEDESKHIMVHEIYRIIFREQRRMKTKHCQQNFIAELF